jgi:Zn-dependent protease
MLGGVPPAQMLAIAIVIFFGIGLHEYAHCKFADMAGDPTPRIYGRVTLDLTKHFELYGTLMMVFSAITGFGIGWGKPAPINPAKMRDPRWDTFIAVAAGPISNIVQAVVWALIARVLFTAQILHWSDFSGIGDDPPFLGILVILGIQINLRLAFFNLFPIPPLDGHWLVGLLLPEKPRDLWFYYCRRYGTYILIALVLVGQAVPALSIFRFASPLINHITTYLLGIPSQ